MCMLRRCLLPGRGGRFLVSCSDGLIKKMFVGECIDPFRHYHRNWRKPVLRTKAWSRTSVADDGQEAGTVGGKSA